MLSTALQGIETSLSPAIQGAVSSLSPTAKDRILPVKLFLDLSSSTDHIDVLQETTSELDLVYLEPVDMDPPSHRATWTHYIPRAHKNWSTWTRGDIGSRTLVASQKKPPETLVMSFPLQILTPKPIMSVANPTNPDKNLPQQDK
jgi:hypothetical protein